MFEMPDISGPNLKDIPTLQDHLKPVIAAVLAGAMLQKSEVPQGDELKFLLDQFQRFRKIL